MTYIPPELDFDTRVFEGFVPSSTFVFETTITLYLAAQAANLLILDRRMEEELCDVAYRLLRLWTGLNNRFPIFFFSNPILTKKGGQTKLSVVRSFSFYR
jgi:hypothetical protein